MADYFKPAWRTAKTAAHHVDAIAPRLTAELGLLVAADPGLNNKDANAVRDRRRESLILALITGVERARTLHDRIKYEKEQLTKAKEHLANIEAAEKWIEGEFNYPKFTPRYLDPEFNIKNFPLDILEILRRGGPIDWIDYEAPPDDPNYIDPNVTEPAFSHIKARLRRRIKIAEKRYPLAGATEQVGLGDPGTEDNAAIRYGTGAMVFWVVRTIQSWVSGWKPTQYHFKILAIIARRLFAAPDRVNSKYVRDALTTALKIEESRDLDSEIWFGYAP